MATRATRNLLLGGGEKLAGRAEIVRGGGEKKMPYTLSEVRDALTDPIRLVKGKLCSTSAMAKPRGEGVFEIVLHPAFLARSYYPSKLLAATGLSDVGSREKVIVPKTATETRLQGKQH